MTDRVVSVWLTHWRTERLKRQGLCKGLHKPLAIIQSGQGGEHIIALNKEAEMQGLHVGQLLTDAKAVFPSLRTIPADPVGEAKDLECLARWCIRFSPWVSIDPPDGLWLDVTGVAHLFGGEGAFLQTLKTSFESLRLSVRLALADTPGAAWGLARFGGKPISIVSVDQQKQVVAPLSVRALQISHDDAERLERLGLKRIGQLYKIPAKSFRARFGTELLERLEQMLLPHREILSPLLPEQKYFASLPFAEPISHLDGLSAALDRLIPQVTQKLATDGKGACRFIITLYDTMGGCFPLKVKACAPTKDSSHVARLFKERLRALEHRFPETFGVDAVSLHGEDISPLKAKQSTLSQGQANRSDVTLLIDRLTARLGRGAVTQFSFRESYSPERAVFLKPADERHETNCKPSPIKTPRPLMLLPNPEPIRAIAEVPDYPPHRFEWRRCTYHVVKAEGPERIAPEWWHDKRSEKTRDYFHVEDQTGAWFWLYRSGLYEAGNRAPQWFMHGMFP